jgi:hypothetical protein
MAETANIYEPQEWLPIAEILTDLASALGSCGQAVRELNVAVFQKRQVRLLREPNDYFGCMQRPEPQIASAEFLDDYRFVLRPSSLDLDFQGAPERYNPRAIMWYSNFLSVEDVNTYWSNLWADNAQDDQENAHPAVKTSANSDAPQDHEDIDEERKSKAGRKPKYDWEVIKVKFFEMVFDADLTVASPPNYSDYARQLAEWAQAKTDFNDGTPDEGTIRVKLREWFDIYCRMKS